MENIFGTCVPDAAGLAAMGVALGELEGPLAWESEDWDLEGWTPEGWTDPSTDTTGAGTDFTGIDFTGTVSAGPTGRDLFGDDPVGSIDVSGAIRAGVGRVTGLQVELSRLQALQMREFADLV